MPRKSKAGWQFVNGTELAAVLKLSPGRVSHLVKQGLPRGDDQRYDLRAAVPWYIEQVALRADSTDLADVRQEYYVAMAEKARLEAEEKKKTVYGRAEVHHFLMGLVVALREAIMAIPERVTRDHAIAHAIDAELSRALNDTAESVAGWCENGAPDQKPAARATATNRRRVGKRKAANATG